MRPIQPPLMRGLYFFGKGVCIDKYGDMVYNLKMKFIFRLERYLCGLPTDTGRGNAV